jgi:hypothetical protein
MANQSPLSLKWQDFVKRAGLKKKKRVGCERSLDIAQDRLQTGSGLLKVMEGRPLS